MVKHYGNLEIIVEGMTQEQLDELMEYVTEKVKALGLNLTGRTYITTDEDYQDAEEPESVA